MSEDQNPFAASKVDDVGAAPSRVQTQLNAADASRKRRFAGYLIDLLLSALASMPGMIWAFWGRSFEEVARKISEASYAEPLVLAMMVPVFVVYLLQSFLIATRGQTVAKVWLKIKIVRLDGRDVGFFDGVFLRYWLPIAVTYLPENLGGVVSLVDAVLIFGQERRCGHDYLARTRVIDIRDQADLAKPLT